MSLQTRIRKYARDFKTLPADVRLVYRRGGWPEVREALADRSLYRVVRIGRMLVIAQELDRIRDVAPPAGVSIRVLAEGDWTALGTLVPQRDLDRFRTHIAAGHTCLIAWRDERPIGYTWYATRVGPDVTLLPLPLPSTAAYLWELYVPPAERSNGIGSALVTARLHLAREAGFREGWRMVAPTNRPSLRTVDKTGGNSRVMGEIRFVKLLSRIFSWYRPSPAAPGVSS